MLGLVVALGAGGPSDAAAQQEANAAVRRHVELRGGLAGHGSGLCARRSVTGAAVGVSVRTIGQWFGSAAADYFFGGQPRGCIDVETFTRYRGQDARLRAGAEIGLRLSASMGYRILGERLEVAGGVGTLPTRTDYSDVGWRLWSGATLTYRLESGAGLQVEGGLHQVPERYLATTEDVVVADELYWEPMWRVGFTVPLF